MVGLSEQQERRPVRRLNLHRADADALAAVCDLEIDRVDSVPVAERTAELRAYQAQMEQIRSRIAESPAVITLDADDLHAVAVALMLTISRVSGRGGDAEVTLLRRMRAMLERVTG